MEKWIVGFLDIVMPFIITAMLVWLVKQIAPAEQLIEWLCILIVFFLVREAYEHE